MRGGWTNEGLKRKVFADVAALAPVDEVERRDISRFCVELAPFADPFSREAGPRHVTGSGFVVGSRGIVLLHHLKLSMWVQPGGHVDDGETPWEAARREVVEETGLPAEYRGGTPELAHVSVHDVPDNHIHYDLRYLFVAGDADPAPPAGESQDVHWFGWADAIERAEPQLTAILRALQARLS